MQEPIYQHLLRLSTAYSMFPAGCHVLVACSGGSDSMCLLHALNALRNILQITVSAAHFNHRLRREAEQEAEFVQTWCEKQGIPCIVGNGSVAAEAARTGQGMEETARALRYAFLERTATDTGAQRIATAHHAEDNSETILFHLIRGSGLRGLSGIPPVRGKIVRPLLTADRQEIRDYLARHQIPHVEDSSNADPAYTRNYLRHQVMPLLKTINPRLTARLWESACQFRQEDAYLDNQAAQLLFAAEALPQGVSLPCAALTGAPEALALRGVQQLASRLEPELILSAAQRRSILTLCRSTHPSGHLELPLSVIARRNYDRLELVRRQETTFAPVPLALPGVTEASGWRFVCERAVCPEGKFNQPRDFYLALPEGAQIILRPRQAGDSITLPARTQKTIKKLLIDTKFPRHLRELLPVFDWNGTVCALTEFGADQTVLPLPGQLAWHITAVPAANLIYRKRR